MSNVLDWRSVQEGDIIHIRPNEAAELSLEEALRRSILPNDLSSPFWDGVFYKVIDRERYTDGIVLTLEREGTGEILTVIEGEQPAILFEDTQFTELPEGREVRSAELATKKQIEMAAWRQVFNQMIELELTPSIVREALSKLEQEDSYCINCCLCESELEFESHERPKEVLCEACQTVVKERPEEVILTKVVCQKCHRSFDAEELAEHQCVIVCGYCNAYKGTDPQRDGADQEDRGLPEVSAQA